MTQPNPPRTLEFDPGADIPGTSMRPTSAKTENPVNQFNAWADWVESEGDRWNTKTASGRTVVERGTWVPAGQSEGGGSSRQSQFGVPEQSSEPGVGEGKWVWTEDRDASIWYETAERAGMFDEEKEKKAKGSGSGSGRAFVEVDPSKKAQSAFSDFLSRAKGVYSLEDQEFDWLQSGNRYNMAMAKDFRDVGGFGFSDLYVGQHPDTKLSRDFRPYVDEGIYDPDWMALSQQPTTGWGNGVRGYAQGTVMGDPMAGVPEKLRPLIGVPSIFVGDAKWVPGIPTGEMEGARQ